MTSNLDPCERTLTFHISHFEYRISACDYIAKINPPTRTETEYVDVGSVPVFRPLSALYFTCALDRFTNAYNMIGRQNH